MTEIKLVINNKYNAGNKIYEPDIQTWFSVAKVAPALRWLLCQDKYSPTAETLATYLTDNGYDVKARTIRDWRTRYKTPEQVWRKVPALAIQLIVEAYNTTRKERFE